MGFLDKLKDRAKEVKEKAVETVEEHSPQIKESIGKAGDFVDKKTKGKYSDKIAKGTQQATAAVDKVKTDDATATPGMPEPTVVTEPVISDPAVTVAPTTQPVTPPPPSAPEPPGSEVPPAEVPPADVAPAEPTEKVTTTSDDAVATGDEPETPPPSSTL